MNDPSNKRSPREARKLVIGVTGTIGAGKSMVAKRLAERGAEVIDADAVGYETLEDARVIKELTGMFGPEILDEDGRVLRTALASLVFASPESLRGLEATMHPRMRRAFEDRIRSSRSSVVVLDAAILCEAGWNALCDRTLIVDAPRELRLERVRRARGWSDQELGERERDQWSIEEKRRHADAWLVNDGSIAQLNQSVDQILEEWRASAERTNEPSARRVKR